METIEIQTSIKILLDEIDKKSGPNIVKILLKNNTNS